MMSRGEGCGRSFRWPGARWPKGGASVAVAILVGLGVVPSLASAAFTRPFVRAIEGTPTGPEGLVVPFSGPGGVAVDLAGSLWVGDGTEALDRFESANAGNGFIKTLKLKGSLRSPEGSTPPGSLSIDYATGDFYVTGVKTVNTYEPFVEVFDGMGALVKFTEWEEREFGLYAHVAVDNSCAWHEPVLTETTSPSCKEFDPSNGTVYVTQGRRGHGQPQGIERFNAAGKPVSFSGSGSIQYVKGNEITGIPGESFGSSVSPAPGGVAVDRDGNIYAVDQNYEGKTEQRSRERAVVEFNAEGRFVRVYTGEQTPGLGEDHVGFGGELQGVAVDPVSGHVLVSLDNSQEKRGAIDEFDSSGHFLNQIAESDGAQLTSVADRGVTEMAFDASGDLYAVDNASHYVAVYGPGHFLPSLKIDEASEREPTGAVLQGAVNPEGQKLSSCSFEYVTEEIFKQEGFSKPSTVECNPTASQITKEEKLSVYYLVQARLTGVLTSGTTYRYRLRATTEGLLGGAAETESLAFTAPDAPRVDSTSATNLSSTFVDIRAQIDPLGADTSYHFEYDTSEYTPGVPHGKSIPVPDADIGSGGATGSEEASILQQIGNLTPGGVYHFRVVASNRVGRVYGPDRSFTTLPQTLSGLPDGRGYELLTPPNKGSAEDMFGEAELEHNSFANRDVGYPSESGEEFILETPAAFGSFAASGQNAYVFRRGEQQAGWQTIPLAWSSLGGVQSVRPEIFDLSNFSHVGVSDDVGSTGGAGGVYFFSLLGSPGGPYVEIHKKFNASGEAGTLEAGTVIAGGSADVSHVILESTDYTLVPGLEHQDQGSHVLYEWANGEIKLVSVKPNGSPFQCGAMLGQASETSNGGGARHNAVSADGSEVFFTAPDPHVGESGSGCWNRATVNAPQLYMRSGSETLELSAPEPGVIENGKKPTQYPAVYVGASDNSKKVFFITETELTKDAVELELHAPELYECEIIEEAKDRKCKLTRVSAGEKSSPAHKPGGSGGDVYTVPAISADGSAVYFTAFGALAPGASALERTEAGPINLYRYDSMTGATVYVATIDVRDYPSLFVGKWWSTITTKIRKSVALETGASWYTTPDGRYLVFESTSALTGYNTAELSHSGPADCPLVKGNSGKFGRCEEVYRYDETAAEKGEAAIICVSCDPSGAPPVSNAFFAEGAGPEAPAGGPVRAMSDDGSHVFFDSADPLVPQADNGTLDVYEWEIPGDGGCERSNGCVHLISSGLDPAPSYFLGASANGSNVFFGTHARLTPQDTDTAGDLYDARIGGGKGVGGGVGPCEGDACQNPPPPPIDASPGSLTFFGAGNFAGEAKPPVTPKKVTPTVAERLAKALKACKKKGGARRGKCESQARNRYAKKSKKSVRARHVSTSGRGGK